ncbi:unnamed protein product, partial [Prorocentrum cordatum]
VVAYQAYEEYLKLQPMDRPMIQPRLNWHDDARYLALATRATSTVEVLFATLVWAGPRTLKDKTDVLEAVERRGKGPVDVKHVHSCLQRWQFDLLRLQRLQMQPPDPVVQLATLRTMVGRMIEQSHTFEHGLSGASTASQRQVDEYWRYLSAESREISGTPPPQPSQAAAGDRGVRAQIARLEAALAKATGSASPKGNGKDKSGKGNAREDKNKSGKQDAHAAAATGLELCRHFESDKGCRNGGQCTRKHRKLEPHENKCFNCGSKQHPKAVARAMQSFAAQADSGYRADWSGQAGDPFAPPDARPRPQQPQQPVMRMLRLNLQGATVAASRHGRFRPEMLLCDSGASHELRHLWPGQAPLPGSVPINLGLAVGQASGEVYMSEDQVVYAVSSTLLQALFPISVYVHELEVSMLWGPARAAISLPGGRAIELVVDRDGSVFISEVQAETLRGMRRLRRAQIGASRFVDCVRAAVVQQSLEQHRAAGHPHFRPDCAECRLAAGR